MKRTVNYRVYDTNTDRKLGSWNNGRHPESDSYYEESLYVNPNGAYYLYMFGGPDSPAILAWGGRADFGVAGMGELIEPISHEEAWAWGKKHLPKPEIFK